MAFLASKEIRDIPITPAPLDEGTLSTARQVCSTALEGVSTELKSSAYAAWLGYYKGFCKTLKWSVPQLIEQAKIFALVSCGYRGEAPGKTPPLLAKTIGMMGLREYRSSFNVVQELPGKPKQPARSNDSNAKAGKKQRVA